MVSPRRWLSVRWLTLAAGAAAALPIAVSTIRALVAGWAPISDQGTIAMRAYDVLTTHTPLLGQYSLTSNVTGYRTYSPGPLLYWLFALPARFGSPATLPLTMALVNIAAVLGIVALARRRGGLPLMFAAAVAVALMCRSFSTESLHDIFNPSAALFPFTLLIFLCWSLACGDIRLLPLIVLVASFVVQCHLAYVGPTVGLLAVGIAGLAVSHWRGAGRSLRRWALAAAAVGAVCWTPPIVQEVTHTPGNLGLLARAVTAHKTTQGATVAARAVVRVLGIPPRWLRPAAGKPDFASRYAGGDYGDTRLGDIRTAPGVVAVASCWLVLAAVLAVGVAGWRRRRADILTAAAISLVLSAAFAVVVYTTPQGVTNTLGYSTWWGSAVGMWVWLSLGWSAASLLGLRARLTSARVPAFASALGLGVVAVAGTAVAATEKRDTHAPDYRAVGTIVERVEHATRGARKVLIVERGFVAITFVPAIKYALQRRGVKSLSVTASPFNLARSDQTIAVYEAAPPLRRRSMLLARISVRDATGEHRIIVTASWPRGRALR